MLRKAPSGDRTLRGRRDPARSPCPLGDIANQPSAFDEPPQANCASLVGPRLLRSDDLGAVACQLLGCRQAGSAETARDDVNAVLGPDPCLASRRSGTSGVSAGRPPVYSAGASSRVGLVPGARGSPATGKSAAKNSHCQKCRPGVGPDRSRGPKRLQAGRSGGSIQKPGSRVGRMALREEAGAIETRELAGRKTGSEQLRLIGLQSPGDCHLACRRRQDRGVVVASPSGTHPRTT